MYRAVGRNLPPPYFYHNMMHPVMFCFGRGSLHFTCYYLPLSAKQMTKDIYPIILFSSKLMCTQQERGSLMQVKIEVSPEHTPPRAVIYTDRITPEIQRALDILQAKDTPVLAERDGRTFLLSEQEVYMIRVVGGETKLYTKKEEFRTRKRLYEVLDQLGSGFMQISKSCAVNLSYVQSVEAGFGGSLLLKMRNGLSDYVSRKYLPDLKNYLGL